MFLADLLRAEEGAEAAGGPPNTFFRLGVLSPASATKAAAALALLRGVVPLVPRAGGI